MGIFWLFLFCFCCSLLQYSEGFVLSSKNYHHDELRYFGQHNGKQQQQRFSKFEMTKNDDEIIVTTTSGGKGGGCGCGGKKKQEKKLPKKLKILWGGYFPEPSFRVMNTGEGTVAVNQDSISNLLDCQFAQFGPRSSFSGRVQWASPPEAHEPLSQLDDDDVVLLVKRGLCSFESKARAAKAIGAKAAILVNSDDETFLAIADTTTTVTQSENSNTSDISSQEEEEDIPFVVVPSSSLAALENGVHVSVEMLDAGKSKCWGNWDTIVPDKENNGESFVVPLFPVSKEPLLPGGELQMRLGKREIKELEQYQQDDNRTLHVAVAYCIDPATNVLAETACLSTVKLSRTTITVTGIEPCVLRTLVRDSTRAGLGLGLIVRKQKEISEEEDILAHAIKRKLRLEDTILNDPEDISFAACAALDLPPRQLQAALASSTIERLRGVKKFLDRDDDTKRKKSTTTSQANFVSAAVKKALPSVVSIESNGGEKAAGFVINKDGIIATNRHVVANSAESGVVDVTFHDGRKLPAEILAVSEIYDIAFLKVNDDDDTTQSKEFAVAPLGDGDNVSLGDWMIAVGSPAEFDHLVSLGIVSTIKQRQRISNGKTTTFIGTDALFNKGISGGPLLNEHGEVVGMCTYMREDLNGLGFAISINRVMDAAEELYSNLE